MSDNYTGFIGHRSGLKHFPYTQILNVGLRTASGTTLRGENRDTEATGPGPIVPVRVDLANVRCDSPAQS